MGSENRGSVVPAEPVYIPDNRFYQVDEQLRSEAECKCPNCVMWTIVYKDASGEEVEIGTSWQGAEGEEAANDVCDLMNMAYEAGRESLTEGKSDD